jgi:signal peptide peptidase SppA
MSSQLAMAMAESLNLQPCLVAAHAVNQITASIRQMAQGRDENMPSVESARVELLGLYGFDSDETEQSKKPFAFAAGLAIIPVHGMLINRFGQSWGWVTGYNFLRAQKNAAEADPDVLGIVYDMNSYGGTVAGCFETSADLFTATKPSIAVVDSACYSACYALASAAGKIVLTPSSGAGSIGVIAAHVSIEKMLKEWGVEVTLIFAGDHKADGNAYESLPEAVRKDIQRDVSATREEFINLVATQRGMDPKVVRDTEARAYRAEEALKLGLVDAIESPSKAVIAFLSELSGSNDNEETTMSTKPTTAGTQDNTDTSQASAQASKAERARIQGIVSHKEAEGRSALANQLAFGTDMSVEDAAAILVVAAKEPAQAEATPAKPEVAATPTVAASPFNVVMDNHGHPKVGADTTDDQEESTLTKDQKAGKKLALAWTQSRK